MGVLSLIRATLERALRQIAGGQYCRPRLTIEWHNMATNSNMDALKLVSYAHEKLPLGRWCVLVDSVKLKRIFYLRQWQLAHLHPQPSFEVIVTSTISEVRQSITATIHKTPLNIYSEAGLCYWYPISKYSLRYKPWSFVEVDGHRDLQKKDKIFIPVCLYNLPHQYQTHISTSPIARRYQNTPFDALPMH